MMTLWTDDPVRDAENYYDDLDEEIESRPVCCECGEHITGEYGYLVGSDWYCEDCMENHMEWF